MSKRYQEDHERVAMIDSLQCSREDEPKVAYAPCPSPDAKWKALLAVCSMPKWSGAMKGVMACLIECANYYSGKCCPSEAWMAKRLKCSDSTVKRAVGKLEKTKYLQVAHRSQESANGKWQANAYVIGWRALINTCHGAFPWTDRGATLQEPGVTFAQDRGAEVTRKDIEGEDIEGRYKHKVAHPPSAYDASNIYSFFEKKEGFQRGAVSDSSPPPQPPCPTENPLTESEAYLTVSSHCDAFDWAHLTQADLAAATAAEVETPGSGRAAIKAASMAAWKAKRTGQAK